MYYGSYETAYQVVSNPCSPRVSSVVVMVLCVDVGAGVEIVEAASCIEVHDAVEIDEGIIVGYGVPQTEL
jgi:hypothetical protein